MALVGVYIVHVYFVPERWDVPTQNISFLIFVHKQNISDLQQSR